MKIHGLDQNIGSVQTDLLGNVVGLSLGTFGQRKIPVQDWVSVEPVSADQVNSVGGAVAGAAIGALLAGPVGAVIGGVLRGRKSSHVVAIELATGETFAAELNQAEFGQLLGAMAKAKNKRFADQFEVSRPNKRPTTKPIEGLIVLLIGAAVVGLLFYLRGPSQ